jgi:flagellar hook protein FlgE
MPPDFANGVQTATSTISAVLDSRENAYVLGSGVAFDPAQNTYNSKTTQTVFDSNGTAHTLNVYYRRISDANLQITSNASGGYTYSPGPTASPNTSQQTLSVIPMTSSLTMVTPANNTLLGSITGTPSLGTGSLSLASAQVLTKDLNIGDHIFINGVDSGLKVAAGYPVGTSLSSVSVTGSAVQIPANASFTFYSGDIDKTLVSSATVSAKMTSAALALGGTLTFGQLTATAASSNALTSIAAGQRVFINGVDTGVIVASTTGTSGNTSAFTLSQSLPVGIQLTDTVSFVAAPTGTVVKTASATTTSNTTGISTLTLVTSSDTPSVGSQLYVNGVNTGLTVTSATATSAVLSGTLSPAVTSGSVAFVPQLTLAAATTLGAKTLTMATGSNVTSGIVGTRVFIGGVDTGVTVSSVTTGTTDTINLSGALPTTYASGAALTFKQDLAMYLTAPDGTNIAVKGSTNKQNSSTILNAVESKVEAYASLDNVFYSPTNTGNKPSSNFTNISAETSGAGGYQPIALMGFVAGRNIDSLVTDSASGKALFSTKVTLTAQVSNGTQQSTTIPLIYNLDLSGTQLQASSFQVTQSSQDGEARSQLASVSIDSDGTIVGVYGNGRKIVAGAIALAHFDASEQLVPTGGNSFAPSYRSGTEGDVGVTIGRPGEGSFGAIKSQAVEQSNVDLSNELVKLMLLQRVYSANSQSLRAFDQTMQDTIRMVG